MAVMDLWKLHLDVAMDIASVGNEWYIIFLLESGLLSSLTNPPSCLGSLLVAFMIYLFPLLLSEREAFKPLFIPQLSLPWSPRASLTAGNFDQVTMGPQFNSQALPLPLFPL